MTRRRYEQLAVKLAEGYKDIPKSIDAILAYRHAVKMVCLALEADNPRFDKDKFMAAIWAVEIYGQWK